MCLGCSSTRIGLSGSLVTVTRLVVAAIGLLVAKPFACPAEEKKPVTLTSIVAELNAEHGKAERDKIFASPSKVISFQIRAKYELWKQEKPPAVKLYFEKQGMRHPDFISGCICQAWELSHSQGKFDEKKLLKEHAAMELQWRKWSQQESLK